MHNFEQRGVSENGTMTTKTSEKEWCNDTDSYECHWIRETRAYIQFYDCSFMLLA